MSGAGDLWETVAQIKARRKAAELLQLAAPDLFYACKLALPFLPHDEMGDSLRRRLDLAIAKAEGRE